MGSNYLGLVLGVLGVLAIMSGTITVWTVLVLLGVFIVDSTSTLLARMREGDVWYHGHKSNASQREARRSEEHTSELKYLMRFSYYVFCLQTHNNTSTKHT